MMPRLLLLFDIDGTLLLSGGAGSRALNRVFLEAHGVDNAMDGVVAAGRTDPLIVADMFKNALSREPDDGEVDALLQAYVPALERELSASENYRLMPHVREILAFLRGTDHTVAIATGNIRAAADAKLRRGQLGEFVPGGYGCDSELRAELVRKGIERAGAETGRRFEPSEVMVIGDTVHDVTAAQACGARAVAVCTGVSSRAPALEAAGADCVLETLEGFPAWLTSFVDAR